MHGSSGTSSSSTSVRAKESWKGSSSGWTTCRTKGGPVVWLKKSKSCQNHLQLFLWRPYYVWMTDWGQKVSEMGKLGQNAICSLTFNWSVLLNQRHGVWSEAEQHCVTRAQLLYFIRSWVALSFKVCESVSESGMRDTCPDLHFVQYIKASMPSTDPVSS